MSFKPVRKAVFPVAGLGTRFLPATKAMPKEMLTVVDKPLIQYAVEEALEAGVEQIIFVTGRGKGALEDHFDISYELEATMRDRGKSLAAIDGIRQKPGSPVYVRQQEPLGLGHAVWCARDIVGDEPFAVILPDMLMQAKTPALAQAVAAHAQVGGNIVVVEPVPESETHKYGIVALDGKGGRLNRMTAMVEKPAPGTAPSNLIISGRYILQPDIFALLEKQGKGSGGEIQLTDSMVELMKTQDFHALEYDGTTFDCGDKIGLLRANVAFALQRPEFAEAARKAIGELL